MDFDKYQKQTHQFFIKDNIKHPTKSDNNDLILARVVLGLAGEAGEIAEKVKKYLRGDYSLEELKNKLPNESGDLLWYLSELNSIFDIKLSEIAKGNLKKLADRRKRGKLIGDGDNR